MPALWSATAAGVPTSFLWATAAGLLLYVVLDGLQVDVRRVRRAFGGA